MGSHKALLLRMVRIYVLTNFSEARLALGQAFFVDGAYDRRTLLDKAGFLNFVVEVVRRI